VIKAERWYLVAGAPRGTRVYRCSRIASIELLRRTFRRPERFELSEFWANHHCARFARARPSYRVELDAEGEPRQLPDRIREQIAGVDQRQRSRIQPELPTQTRLDDAEALAPEIVGSVADQLRPNARRRAELSGPPANAGCSATALRIRRRR
jgi:predicted DNA-binding transcriptional regulator YafY